MRCRGACVPFRGRFPRFPAAEGTRLSAWICSWHDRAFPQCAWGNAIDNAPTPPFSRVSPRAWGNATHQWRRLFPVCAFPRAWGNDVHTHRTGTSQGVSLTGVEQREKGSPRDDWDLPVIAGDKHQAPFFRRAGRGEHATSYDACLSFFEPTAQGKKGARFSEFPCEKRYASESLRTPSQRGRAVA